MIGYLEGHVVYKTLSYTIVNVGGVGYKVFVVPQLLETPQGQAIKMFVYHKSSDDGQSLFGFPDVVSLHFFELLLTVSGVGPKIALSILSSGDMNTLKEAIAQQDSAFFSQMGGIGKKTAERIIVDLKDKIGILTSDAASTNGSSDVFDALTGLGYSTNEARRVLTDIDRSAPMEAQLKQALKLLSKT
ncbi:MAG: Holliday junction branch migration protein RuvA [Candidatus Doudnabacteria bacterium]|nr:Holliday junction branch migration protein RuvA [Candidatus Doudnabacteria bacterium]